METRCMGHDCLRSAFKEGAGPHGEPLLVTELANNGDPRILDLWVGDDPMCNGVSGYSRVCEYFRVMGKGCSVTQWPCKVAQVPIHFNSCPVGKLQRKNDALHAAAGKPEVKSKLTREPDGWKFVVHYPGGRHE